MSDLSPSFSREIAALRRLVELSSGTPSFAFALCNKPTERRRIITEMLSPQIAVAELPADTVDPVATARALVLAEHRGAVFVTGLENLLSEAHPDSTGHIARINRSRERWRASFPAQLVVFWLSEQALLRILREAPDFRAWVSHDLEFIDPPIALSSEKQPEPSVTSAFWADDPPARRVVLIKESLSDNENLPPMLRLSLIRELLSRAPADKEAKALIEHGIRKSLDNIRQRADNIHDVQAQQDSKLALDEVADIYRELGESQAALRHYKEAHAIAVSFYASDPTNAEWQGHLSVSLDRLGNLAKAQDSPVEAMHYYREERTIIQRLSGNDPGNAKRQHDLSLLLNKIGDLAMADDNLTEATQYYKEQKTIAERLCASDPANVAWQSDLSVLLGKLGEVALAHGDMAEALHYLTEEKIIAERMDASNPTDPQSPLGVYNSQIKFGIVSFVIGELEKANGYFSGSLGIARKQAAAEPANAVWHYNLCVSLVRLGYFAVAVGGLTDAIRCFTEESDLWKSFSENHKEYEGWKDAPSYKLRKLVTHTQVQCDLTGALEYYKKVTNIDERLKDKDPANILWLREQSRLLEELGDLVAKSELWPGSLSCLNLYKTIEKEFFPNDSDRVAEIEEKRRKVISEIGHLVHKLKAKDTTGRWAYYFVLVFEAREKAFMEAIEGNGNGTIDLEDYGEVIGSCYGEEPNQEVKDYLKKTYDYAI